MFLEKISLLVKAKRTRHDLIVELLLPQQRNVQIGSYFPNLVACHDSMFSSQGQVSSTIITVFVVVE